MSEIERGLEKGKTNNEGMNYFWGTILETAV